MNALRLLGGIWVVMALTFVLGCSEKTMSEEWCEQMMEKPNREWQEEEFKLFAKSCIPEDES